MAILNQYKQIPIGQIRINRDARQRREINADDLVASIRARGIIIPLIVERTSSGDMFLLVAGERRITAAAAAGLTTVPCRLAAELSDTERQIIELEENVKRKDLPWKDEVLAVQRIHELYLQLTPDQTQSQTADMIGMNQGLLSMMLRVAEEVKAGNPLVLASTSYRSAYNIIARRDGRAVDDVMNELMEEPVFQPVPAKSVMISDSQGGQLAARVVAISPPPSPDSIQNVDFCQWISTYTGRPFNFLHCDFPYGIGLDQSDQANTKSYGGYDDSEATYWKLCQCLADNRDRLISQSAHIFFWLSSDIERQWATIQFFRSAAPDLEFRKVPCFWHKTDNRGILPDPKRGPRQIIETALIASRGDRNVVKSVSNAYGAPTSKEVHQSEKPVPVLRHFFQMFIDENTRMFDPTCGGGSSLRAAESLGAREVTGLEINPDFCEGARTALRKFRNLRALEKRNG